MLVPLHRALTRHSPTRLLSNRTYTTVPCFQVDSFSNTPFQGNPAAVCLLTPTTNNEWPLNDETLLKIAAENNLSETAFIIPTSTTINNSTTNFAEDSHFHLRWFTPTTEVDLCGHATLATAAVLLQKCQNKNASLHFATKSGELIASSIQGTDAIEMVLPLNPPVDLDHFMESHRELADAVLGGQNHEDVVDSMSYSGECCLFYVLKCCGLLCLLFEKRIVQRCVSCFTDSLAYFFAAVVFVSSFIFISSSHHKKVCCHSGFQKSKSSMVRKFNTLI